MFVDKAFHCLCNVALLGAAFWYNQALLGYISPKNLSLGKHSSLFSSGCSEKEENKFCNIDTRSHEGLTLPTVPYAI